MATGSIKKPGLEIVKYSTTVQGTLKGNSITVNIYDAIPTGKHISAYCEFFVNNYPLPYLGQIGQNKATYVETANPTTGVVIIRDNGTSGWPNPRITVVFAVE